MPNGEKTHVLIFESSRITGMLRASKSKFEILAKYAYFLKTATMYINAILYFATPAKIEFSVMLCQH